MTGALLVLIVLSQVLMVAGQVLLKHALNGLDEGAGTGLWKKAVPFVYSIGVMALWFFLWIGLLSRFDLSYLFPFDALSPILMAMGASLVLKEKVTPRLWCGILLIVVGLLIVGVSQ